MKFEFLSSSYAKSAAIMLTSNQIYLDSHMKPTKTTIKITFPLIKGIG